MRNADLLFTEPVVFFFSLWVSFSWAVLYLMYSVVPLVFTTNHGFYLQQNGAVFTGKLQANSASSHTNNQTSNDRRLHPLHRHEHLPGKNSPSLRQNVLHTRRTPILQLHTSRSLTSRTLLVRLDPRTIHTLDSANHGNRRHHNGALLHLSRHIPLLSRYVPTLCQLRFGRTILLYVRLLLLNPITNPQDGEN